MIISHEHKFIFLKTRKTAGTSVERALRQLCGPDDIIAPIGDAEEQRQQACTIRAGHHRIGGCTAGGKARVHCSSAIGSASARAITGSTITFRRNRPARYNDDRVWRSYFKFGFERNPWDRQVSAYHFRYRDTKDA